MSGLPAAGVENQNYFFQIAYETGASLGGLQITDITYLDDSVTLTWRSKPSLLYAVDYFIDEASGWIEKIDDLRLPC